ncbi:hypothetical protein [Burkholderia sp. 4M9327F10]|uniref:hypothetical protein n=1 Tax=Burkholderia sp. 4M9327F10 TaxID=2502223 RepID=UPI0010F8D429|nr:hypothetical protein [Burkholderia sp. 4M9327F10]
MPDRSRYGLCSACGKPLAALHYAFALHRHSITYAGTGETPNEQGRLHIDAIVKQVQFCSKDCCEAQLPELLEAHGLPSSLQGNQVDAGPIHPCVPCGKPVNMSEPHGAWVRAKQSYARRCDNSGITAEWLDVMAVVCDSCAGMKASVTTAEKAPRTDERPGTVLNA